MRQIFTNLTILSFLINFHQILWLKLTICQIFLSLILITIISINHYHLYQLYHLYQSLSTIISTSILDIDRVEIEIGKEGMEFRENQQKWVWIYVQHMNNGTLLQAKTTLIRSHQKSEELSTPFLFLPLLVACFDMQ